MSSLLADIDALPRPSADANTVPPLLSKLIRELANPPLLNLTDDTSTSELLSKSIRYSLGLSGKRARGVLVLLIADGWGKPWQSAVDCAHAVEIVHTASLIIDDLPVMDDATTRRGAPTNHVKFGNSTALMAGIALMSEALRLLATSERLDPKQQSHAVACLAGAIGPAGMAAGQTRDMSPPSSTLADIELTHALKTGSLFAAAAELGCIAAGVGGPRKWLLSDFGMLLGKAFQELDDLIDISSTPDVAGKDTTKDDDKPTIVGLVGREAATKHALKQIDLALECLDASQIHADLVRSYVLHLVQEMQKIIDGTASNSREAQ